MAAHKKLLFLFIACALLTGLRAGAHVIAFELDAAEELTQSQVFWKYLATGYEHIIPKGYDHILFILCVFFLNTSIRKIVLQATMFTLAHSITLGLAMYGIIKPEARVVEPLIALSIVALALENIFSSKVKPWRLVMVFLFGLVHGMGFAGALGDLGMPKYAFATALIAFNVGVELGQLSIIIFMYLAVALPLARKIWYRRQIVIPVSIVIALVAAFLTVQRIFFPNLIS